MKQICILRLSALGDCCHALSVIEALQRKLPSARLAWVIGKTEYQLFRDLPGIDFIVVDKANLLKSFFSVFSESRKREFDVLLNLHASASANFISLAIKSIRKIGYDKARARDKQSWFCGESINAVDCQHVAEGMMEFVRALDIEVDKPKWTPLSLEPEETEVVEYIDIGRKTCLISPCSSQRYGDKYNRSWPVEKFVEVIRYLSEEKRLRVIVCGGRSPLEVSYCRKLNAEKFDGNVLNLIGKTSIREMAALIKSVDFVISPDSGPAHIATVMKKPVIGLYSMSNPDRSGPYDSGRWLVNRYPQALSRYRSAKVNEVKWGQKVKTPDAMAMIEVPSVLDKIDGLLRDLDRQSSEK
ncbi:MAG: hypothetical protein CMQ40_05205 [Gammaproteobacteria bacterium]|nr:hypothetical protein [Gammaproteobacteria bacterium]